MNFSSDPFLARPEVPRRTSWSDPLARRAVAQRSPAGPPAVRPRLQRVLARGVVIVAAALLALRAVAGWLAEPLELSSVNAPTWHVEVTSSSTSSVLALAYSREAGIHVLRVPGMGNSDEPRVIPAQLARGELHLISLGLSGLRARADGPTGVPLKSWSAEARTITAYQHPSRTGVRTGW